MSLSEQCLALSHEYSDALAERTRLEKEIAQQMNTGHGINMQKMAESARLYGEMMHVHWVAQEYGCQWANLVFEQDDA